MRVRAIAALNAHADDRFLQEIGSGLKLIAQHASRLAEAAARLAEGDQGRAMRVMELIASEEAAKYLVLLDAVRCPIHPPRRRVRQLKRFNDHLAKGIYAASVNARPAHFGELLEFIRSMRQAFYIDGPTGMNWIFPNEVRGRREEALYVDYVEAEGEHRWWAPNPVWDDPSITRMHVVPRVVKLVKAMDIVRFHAVPSLRTIMNKWRGFDPDPDTRMTELRRRTAATLDKLGEQRWPEGMPSEARNTILEAWPFPLWNQDLSEIEVNPDDLRSQRDSFAPGFR